MCIFGPKRDSSTKKVLCHAQNPNFQLSLGFYLDIYQILKVWSPLGTRILSTNFGPKKVSSTKKVLCHDQNPNFQLSLGFYLDTDQILKLWSPLDKQISLRKFWSQKGFQYQKSTMPCPKSKFSTFIRFLPRYWPNPESLVTIGQTDLSPQILVPKRFPVPKKYYAMHKIQNFNFH